MGLVGAAWSPVSSASFTVDVSLASAFPVASLPVLMEDIMRVDGFENVWRVDGKGRCVEEVCKEGDNI